MDKLGKNPWTLLERAPLTSKTAKFESDLLKTNDDIASQRREILQTLVYGGRGGGSKKTILSPHKRLYISTTLRSYILGVIGQQGLVRLPPYPSEYHYFVARAPTLTMSFSHYPFLTNDLQLSLIVSGRPVSIAYWSKMVVAGGP